MSKYRKDVEVECCVCGKKIIRDKYQINWSRKKNPDYGSTCSSKCRGDKILKKYKTCNILKDHKHIVQNDPEGFSTERIVDIMCETKPQSGTYICTTPVTRSKTGRGQKGHKGMYSRRESIRLSNLIRDGKASRYHNYTDVESAIEKAGI